MDDEGEWISPATTAAALAPIVDRLRLAIAHRIPEAAQQVLSKFAVTGGAMQTLAMLRNTMPDRVVARTQVFDVFLYSPRTAITESIEQLVSCGLLGAIDSECLQLTTAGQACVTDLYGCGAAIVDELWAGHAELVSRLAPLTARVVSAAQVTGGPALAVMTPLYEPSSAPTAMLLAERLTPLRFHRFDAHAAAWRAAGLTLAEIQMLAPGPTRDAIETETSRLDGAAYAALTPADRIALIAGLGALPN